MNVENLEAAPEVAADTDDLDAFSDLLNGKAVEKTEATEETVENNETPEEVEEEQGESLEENEEAAEEPDEESETAKPVKKTNRFQERINELVAQAREAERQKQEVEARLAELERKNSTSNEKPAVKEAANAPKFDDLNEDGTEKYPLGEFDPNYIRDLTRFTIQEEQKAAREAEDKRRAEAQEQEVRQALDAQWQEKLAPATEKYDDFLDKTIQLENTFDGLDPNYSDYLVQTIKSLENGADVLYYFANNLDEASRIVKSGPLAATLALGEINALFKSSATAEKTPPKVSKAPPPPQLNKGAAARTVVAGDTDDLDAFSKAFFAKK